MKKIPTIFNRDWEGDRKVINSYIAKFDFENAVATEKLDGTNIRVTVRNHQVVRVEKRRNPTKIQKANNITDPWYIDADEYSPEDKNIFLAVQGRDYAGIPDGEWSGEALGPKIQGNSLNLEKPTVCFFTLGEAPELNDVPKLKIASLETFNELKEYLRTKQSFFGNGIIEGIVWHWPDGDMAKIKGKDFNQARKGENLTQPK